MKRVRLAVLVSIAAVAVTAGATLIARQRVMRTRDVSRGVEPTVTIAPSGVPVFAWMHVGGEAGEREGDELAADAIAVRVAPAASERGTVALARSPDGRFAADPGLVALPSGGVLLTWLGFRENLAEHGEAYDMRVFAARVDPATAAIGAPVSVAGDAPSGEYDRPWPTVTSSGRIVVAYRFARGGDAGIAVATSRDGIAWERHDVLTAFGFKGGLVTACAASGGAHVYIAYFDPVRGLQLRASHDDGEHFADDAESVVSAADENVAAEAPSCFASGDDVVVAYGVAAGPLDSASSAVLDRVVVARSRDGGRTFSERTVVREPGRLLLHPRAVALGAGFALAAYALEAKDARDAELRIVRGGFGDAALRSVTVRSGLRVAARRSDVGWTGDYLGFVVHGTRADLAFVDAASGLPRVTQATRTLEP